MPPRGRKVALHRDRLAPFRGNLTIYFQKRKPNPLASQNNTDIDPMPEPHTPVVQEPFPQTPHTQPLLLDFPLYPMSLPPIFLWAQIPSLLCGQRGGGAGLGTLKTLFAPLWMRILLFKGRAV